MAKNNKPTRGVTNSSGHESMTKVDKISTFKEVDYRIKYSSHTFYYRVSRCTRLRAAWLPVKTNSRRRGSTGLLLPNP